MTMFALNRTILLVGVRTGKTVGNAIGLKKFGQRSKFTPPPPIGLNNFGFKIEVSFNIFLELNENWECIIFVRNRK
jgi:hypothetical protein